MCHLHNLCTVVFRLISSWQISCLLLSPVSNFLHQWICTIPNYEDEKDGIPKLSPPLPQKILLWSLIWNLLIQIGFHNFSSVAFAYILQPLTGGQVGEGFEEGPLRSFPYSKHMWKAKRTGRQIPLCTLYPWWSGPARWPIVHCPT